MNIEVAPCAGAWIETQTTIENVRIITGRALRGRVD